ncbi:MAG TPA: PIN domain-containing protein [Thermomicrobiales bacterium]|nr:PIN domain-containing protein [Thermomicrobiales bacterium]
MIVLDASVWVSSLQNRDVNHFVSRQWTTEWLDAGHKMVVPTLFLSEVGGAVARPPRDSALGRRVVADIIGDPAFTLVALDQALAEAAANHASDLFLRGADAVYVALAEQLAIPLVTWDQEQLSRAATLVDVRTPTTSLRTQI